MHETWIWMKNGDHLAVTSDLCAKFVAENGNQAVGSDFHARRAVRPDGSVVTFVVADDPWWQAHFKSHPDGWRGAPFARLADHLG